MTRRTTLSKAQLSVIKAHLDDPVKLRDGVVRLGDMTVEQHREVAEMLREQAEQLGQAIDGLKRVVAFARGCNYRDELGPLLEEAVVIAGQPGVTGTELRDCFPHHGKERFANALAYMRSSERITETREPRFNRVGRKQPQVVFRARV
jgi:hypothetical protein